MADGRIRVWRQRGTAYARRNIQETGPFGGGSVLVWGCVPHDCKIALITVQWTFTGQTNQTCCNSHFDNNPLLTRPIFMDDNARPRMSRAVITCLRQNAVSAIPWPAHSPDLNPIEHLWDILGRKVRAIYPQHRILPIWKLLCIESGVRYPNVKFNVWSRVCGGALER